jgi:WD40 repeat protein
MNRLLTIAVCVLLSIALQASAQSVVKDDVKNYAVALNKAYAALEHNDASSARIALDATDKDLRGMAFKLLQQIAVDKNPQKSLVGNPVPQSDTPSMLAVLSPTKSLVAYLCDGGVVLLYDLTQPNGKPNKIISSRGKRLMYGSFSTDGNFFVASDAEGGVIVWDAVSWKQKMSLVKGDQPIRYVAIDKDGTRLLAETEEGVVLWDVKHNQQIAIVGERYNFGTSLCFSNDQRHCATGGLSSIAIYDTTDGKKVREINHAPYTMHLCFSDDGRFIASGLRGSLNKYFGVFEVESGNTVFDHAEHDKGITGLIFVDDGKCLLSTAADGTLKFWHIPSGIELLTMKMGTSIYQPSVTLDGSIVLWNQRSGPRYFLITPAHNRPSQTIEP